MEDILLVHRKSNKIFSEPLAQLGIWKTCLRQIAFCTEADLMMTEDCLDSQDQILRGEKALTLLLEILCGLHSPILGETEVFGQFKAFVENQKTLGNSLFGEHQKWLHFIFTEVKKARAESLTGLGSQSYGSLIRRHTRDLNSVSICGSGQLALEILPWVTQKTQKQVQLICRTPEKVQHLQEAHSKLKISNYEQTYIHGEALVIAAPISDDMILQLIRRQEGRPRAIYDLRGEENSLISRVQQEFSHIEVMSLHQFFAEIEETKKETSLKVDSLKEGFLQKALAFIQRTELRPLGWDDLCA